MQRAGMWSLLVLVLALQEVTAFPELTILPQENFDLGRFLGKWFEVAVVSTCPHYMRRRRGDPVIPALELQHVAPEGNFSVTRIGLRNGACKRTSTDYALTRAPGKFFHHVERFGADVHSFVVGTDYDGYAMMLQLSTEKPLETKTFTLRLFSRSMNVTQAVLEDFKSLARRHGMNDSAVIVNTIKGECNPGEQVTDSQGKR